MHIECRFRKISFGPKVSLTDKRFKERVKAIFNLLCGKLTRMPTSLKIIFYFRTGYLLHIVTVIEILFAGYLFTSSWFIDWLGDIHFVPRVIIPAIIISLPFFAQLDARSRYQNYKMLMDRFYFYGFQLRIIKPLMPVLTSSKKMDWYKYSVRVDA